MSPNDRRQTITLLVGVSAAILAALAGLLVSDVPVHLRSLVSNATAWAIAFTCTLPILIVLATNQISLLLKSSTDREETVKDVVRLLPHSSLVLHFETSAEAMNYLIQNVRRAKHIYNTRLADGRVEASDPLNLVLTKRFDDALWKAIMDGTHYNLIVSPDHAAVAATLLEARGAHAATHDTTGICCSWVLGQSTIPLFQFCILEYGDSRELLIGWALTSSRSFAEKVFLLRDDRLVQYFRSLFELYVQAASPATAPGSGN
jgi:hypothetical protein